MTLKQELRRYRRVFIVCDRNVEDFARQLAGGMPGQVRHSGKHPVRDGQAGMEAYPIMAVVADEAHKNMETALQICRWLLEQGADRDALLLAVGGGVTTDLAGFAACIYKRGIRYANFPTTLLSQVDAGIGGKTGANLDGYKNILGVIRQPEFTAIFPEVLRTLPEREFRSGLAEMLKTFIISNPSHAYERAIALMAITPGTAPALPDGEFRYRAPFSGARTCPFPDAEGVPGGLAELIHLAAGIKQGIVEKDGNERGLRRKLNLGHTWAHAIEWWQSRNEDPGRSILSHGEAVAIGIVQAAKLSETLGIAEKGLADRLKADLESCGLPTGLPCPVKELLPAIQKDKKAEGGLVRFVLPVKVGRVVVKAIGPQLLLQP